MNFEKALEHLMKREKIRRKEWNSQCHLRLENDCITAYRGECVLWLPVVDVIRDTSWHVVGDDKKLSFVEVLEALSQKKHVTHDLFLDGAYIFVEDGQFVMCRAIEDKFFMPTYKCYRANDWEVMK